MALFFPRALTMDSSLAVTLSDCDAHCLRLKGATEAMVSECLSYGSAGQRLTNLNLTKERQEGVLLVFEQMCGCGCGSQQLFLCFIVP